MASEDWASIIQTMSRQRKPKKVPIRRARRLVLIATILVHSVYFASVKVPKSRRSRQLPPHSPFRDEEVAGAAARNYGRVDHQAAANRAVGPIRSIEAALLCSRAASQGFDVFSMHVAGPGSRFWIPGRARRNHLRKSTNRTESRSSSRTIERKKDRTSECCCRLARPCSAGLSSLFGATTAKPTAALDFRRC